MNFVCAQIAGALPVLLRTTRRIEAEGRGRLDDFFLQCPSEDFADERLKSVRLDRSGSRFPAEQFFDVATSDLTNLPIMPFSEIDIDQALHLTARAMVLGIVLHEGFSHSAEDALCLSLFS